MWKRTVSAEFQVNSPKLCGNCAFRKNCRARELGESSVFYSVKVGGFSGFAIHLHLLYTLILKIPRKRTRQSLLINIVFQKTSKIDVLYVFHRSWHRTAEGHNRIKYYRLGNFNSVSDQFHFLFSNVCLLPVDELPGFWN